MAKNKPENKHASTCQCNKCIPNFKDFLKNNLPKEICWKCLNEGNANPGGPNGLCNKHSKKE